MPYFSRGCHRGQAGQTRGFRPRRAAGEGGKPPPLFPLLETDATTQNAFKHAPDVVSLSVLASVWGRHHPTPPLNRAPHLLCRVYILCIRRGVRCVHVVHLEAKSLNLLELERLRATHRQAVREQNVAEHKDGEKNRRPTLSHTRDTRVIGGVAGRGRGETTGS